IVFAGCLLLFALLCTAPLQAQTVQETNIRFRKVERPGLRAEYPYSKGIVENALRARLERAGLSKPKSDKGFMSYQAASWAEVAPGQVDIYTRVDGKGLQSSVSMLVSKGYDNYVSATSDPAMSEKLKAFLGSLLTDIQGEQLKADITAQEAVIRQAEKAYSDVDADGNRLAREKERIEKQIADHAAEKNRRAESVNAERSKLESLKGQIK